MPVLEPPPIGREKNSRPFSQNPDRFRTAPKTLWIDRFMTRFIKVGGIAIIAAVLGIFIFIFFQILPLFKGAQVRALKTLDLGPGDFKILGADEWCQKPFVVDAAGGIFFLDAGDFKSLQKWDPKFSESKNFSSLKYKPEHKSLVFGSSDGFFSVVKIDYEEKYSGGVRQIAPRSAPAPFFKIAAGVIEDIDYADSGSRKLAAAISRQGGKALVSLLTLEQSRTLFGEGKISEGRRFELSRWIEGEPKKVLVNSSTEDILVHTTEGTVFYFHLIGETLELRQTFKPFGDGADPSIASMDYVFGGVSVVFTDPKGANRVFSLSLPKDGDKRLFRQSKELGSLGQGAEFYSPSLRNKAFLIGWDSHASLRYMTTGKTRWQAHFPFEIVTAILGPKYNQMLFLDTTGKLHFYELKDPHPEAGWEAFFGKLWYEGSPQPKYEWQSTGGSDEFEPKLSLIPLIIGTLKGTFYAMIFALPLALLAALYTSQFAHSKLRTAVKPTMEVMASLPSVVLGFLSALWLAPLIERKIPSVLLMIILIPLSAFLTGIVFQKMGPASKKVLRYGCEFLVLVPVVLGVGILCWSLGPWMDTLFFGGDFRLWWPKVTGTAFEQRNSLVVGFIMGFAVIPIIFTIAEDAMSNVPRYLKSGSLALGASRWQTAFHVVLPTASAGIFSAFMIGLGRAIGETMIVVMATGNTPIMDFNIFSGMRTLSANIAVELPEAPHHSTLYRSLFLGAMVLFLATFAVNTVAEILRQRLREKYKTV
jgi:phosphate transport system permease protein